ncbi:MULTISPECIES: ATP-binding cassette domain-containing protein [unclassified Microbacterium]|uniref:ATP-binding cassette domain-containing protein n=1 Tax=unclassified Microbacterium TaxID=2609290 RepID=UPI003016092F
MTASAPLPENDPGERAVTLPPLPAQSAEDAAAAPPAPPLPRAPRKPRRKTTATKRIPAVKPEAAAAPAPPPPTVSAAVAAAQRATHAPDVVAPESDAPQDTEPEIAPELEAPSESAPHPEPEPELGREPDPEPEPEPEPEPVEEAPTIDIQLDVDIDAAVPALRVRGLAKWFGQTRAVDAVDLTIPAGTFYGVVGPNGAGKTTTLSMIAGLLRADEGTVEIAGIDLAADPARAKRQMGILPDRLRTFDRLTGRQLLHYYGVLRGLSSSVVESRTADLARAFDLTDALGRTVSDYSTGMTKKLMLAGAMIHSPRLLVLDEPFESVDPVSSAVILDILSAYVAHGGTVVLSSHGMDLVERVCDGVAVIVAGQVLAAGTVDEVRGERSLEQRFLELAGGLTDVEGLEWLHTFSD